MHWDCKILFIVPFKRGFPLIRPLFYCRRRGLYAIWGAFMPSVLWYFCSTFNIHFYDHRLHKTRKTTVRFSYSTVKEYWPVHVHILHLNLYQLIDLFMFIYSI
jgi:hypothetical protein